MLEPTDKVLVAVSGGVDSMVLLSLINQLDCQIGVAHVNYHLRGEDSIQDQALVEKWCNDSEVSFHLREVSPEEYDIGESIQMVARTIRYQFFSRLKDQFGYTKIATAHNANDNLETVLLNLTKGTGIFGLTGIAPILENYIVRPILFASKDEIYDYAKSNDIAWREDVSNAKNDYQRNQIRNLVLPELKKINPNLESTFQDSVDRLKGVAQITTNELAQHGIADHETHQELMIDWVNDDLKSLVLLSELLKKFDVSYKSAKDIHEAILNRSVGAMFNTNAHRINLDRDRLVITAKPSSNNDVVYLTEEVGERKLGNGKIIWRKFIGSALPAQFVKNEAYFDLDRIQWPLVVRNWVQGDVFQPFGMTGKKKVSDFMIDSKIPVTLKQQVLILESEKEIMWLIGHRTDERFKVTSETKAMLKIEFLPNA